MTDQPREPIRKSLLPCIPPPEWEFHSVLGAPHGCALLPVDTGAVVVRRRVIYGDWEPVRPDRWAPEPPSGALSAPRSVPQASDGPADGQDAHGGAEGPQGGPAELTAEEARALADQLGTDLYRAQDALAFVAECCTIADREQRPITTATVREWLKGAQCGRQLAADNPGLYNRVAAMFARPLPRPWPTTEGDPDTVTDPAYLRDLYAAAIWERQNPGRHYADCEYRWRADAEADADAVLRVRDRHLEQLRRFEPEH